MGSNYVPLFSIQLLHNYFNGNQCSSVQLTPDSATGVLMRNLNMKWRQLNNVAYFYILSNPTNAAQPLVYPGATDVFRFSLTVTDPAFFNYTNLYGWGGSNLYYFSNQANNRFGSPTENYLSQAVGAPVLSAYNKGQLYFDSTNIYEAAQYPSVATVPSSGNSYNFAISGGTSYPATGNTDLNYLWYNRGANQNFASSQDVCQTAGGSYNFALPGTSTTTNTTIYGYNVKTNQYDILVTNPPIFQDYGTGTPTACNVNLQSLAPGLYQVAVNGSTQTLFVDNTGQLTNGLGLIEIYAVPNNATYSGNYELINGDLFSGTINSTPPVYTIQFANNLVYWQYIPATIPTGSSAHLTTIAALGNISFYDFSGSQTIPNGGGTVSVPDNFRTGTSQLMIPLIDTISSNVQPYPVANGPPSYTTVLPLPQVARLTLVNDTTNFATYSSSSGLVPKLLVSQNYLNVF